MSERARPVSAKDMQRAFISPPPDVLRKSALYQALPEAAIHQDNSSVLDRLRASAMASAVRSADTTLPPRVVREQVSTVLSPSPTRRRPASAPIWVIEASKRASSAKASGTGARAASALKRGEPLPAFDTSVPRPTTASCKKGKGLAERLGVVPPMLFGTEFMLQQARQVAELHEAHRHSQAAVAAARSEEWAARRKERDDRRRALAMETQRRIQLKEARQAAIQQQKLQHSHERDAEGFAERKDRSSLERDEREARHQLRYSCWIGVRDITMLEGIRTNAANEVRLRAQLMGHYVGETEHKRRQFLQRFHVLSRTVIMSKEKADRVSLQKMLNARSAHQMALDTHQNQFFAAERRARQKLYDEESVSFMDIDGAKQGWLADIARDVRRKHDEYVGKIKAFEAAQATERADIDGAENDARQAKRSEELTLRDIIRTDFVNEMKTALDRCKQRQAREHEEWEAQCAREQEPYVRAEAEARRRLELVWSRERATMLSLERQEREEILIPIDWSLADPRPQLVHYSSGLPLPLFPFTTFRRKAHESYQSIDIIAASLVAKLGKGTCQGDELLLAVPQVSSAKEKPKGFATGANTLRMLFDSTVIDEDGSTVCVVGQDASGNEAEEGDGEDRSSTSLSLEFVFTEGQSIEVIESSLERCAHCIAFSAGACNTNFQDREVELLFTFLAGGKQPKLRRRLAQLKKTTTGCKQYTLVQRVAVSCASPLVSLSEHAGTRQVIPFDLRKRIPGQKAPPVPCFSCLHIFDGAQLLDFAGGSLRVRFFDGATPEDFIGFLPSSDAGFHVRKNDVKLEDLLFCRTQGKFNVAGAKDVTFVFPDPDVAPTPTPFQPLNLANITRFLSRITFMSAADNPTKGARVMEATISQSRCSTGSAMASVQLVSEVFVCGTHDENVGIHGVNWVSAVEYRDPYCTAPALLHKFLSPAVAHLFPSTTAIEGRGPMQGKESFVGGCLKVTISEAASPGDSLHLVTEHPTPHGVLSLVATGAKDLKLMLTPHGGDGHSIILGKMLKVSAGPNARHVLQIDFDSKTEIKFATLAMLLQSLTYQGHPSVDILGCTKAVQVELNFENGKRAKGSGMGPTRVTRNVQVLPSIVSANPIGMPKQATPQRLTGFGIDPSAFNAAFDGGFVRFEIVDGRSAFEVLSLAVPELGFDVEESWAAGQQVSFASGASGDIAVFVGDGNLIGSVAEVTPGQPMTINFLTKHGVASPHKGAEPSVRGNHVMQLLQCFWYEHSEADSFLEKACRITVEDSDGRRSQTVFLLTIEANFCPTVLVNPPVDVFFRHRSWPKCGDEIIPLFSGSDLEDDDTENVGKCVLTIEPYDGTVDDDILAFVKPFGSSEERRVGRFTFVDHPVDPNKTAICYDGREVAWVVNERLGVSSANVDESRGETSDVAAVARAATQQDDEPDSRPQGNRLLMSIKTGTSLSVCAEITRLIGFTHTETHPKRTHVRRFEYRFNAGDEPVPDTRAVFAVHVQPPLLSILPIHAQMRFKGRSSGLIVFPQPSIGGVSPSSLLSGNKLDCLLSNEQDRDCLSFFQDNDIFLSDGQIVVSVALAKQLSQKVDGATPGYSGVLVAGIVSTATRIAITFEQDCPLKTAALPALVRRFMFVNDSSTPADVERIVTAVWTRCDPPEAGYVEATISVEPEDDATEVTLRQTMVSTFAREDCSLFAGCTVSDTDTPVFENGASMSVEVVQGSIGGVDKLELSTESNFGFTVSPSHELLLNGRRVGRWEEKGGRRVHIDFFGINLEDVQRLCQAFIIRLHDRQKATKIVQLALRGGPAVTPTVANVQVTVYPRLLSPLVPATQQRDHHLVLDRGTSSTLRIFPELPDLAPGSIAGLHVLISLCDTPLKDAKGAATTLRKLHPTCDRLTLAWHLPEDWVLLKGGTLQGPGGVAVCTIGDLGAASTLTIAFPKTVKSTTETLAAVLHAVAYEIGEPPRAEPDDKHKPAKAKDRLPANQKQKTPEADPVADDSLCGVLRCSVAITVPLLDNVAVMREHRYIHVQM